jgi:uroporphyrinogen-III synthase
VRVVITRAEPGASETRARIVALGHEALLAPALRIEPIPGAPPVAGVQAVLFTSSNGARLFASLSPARPPAYCVGDATAEAARAAGFAEVQSADGDLHALAALVRARLDPRGGRLLHAAGADLAGDLAALLRASGYDVAVHACYRAVESGDLPDDVTAALAGGRVDAVLFHSARGASAFVKQVKARDALARIDAVCLSRAVEKAATVVPWRRVLTADSPNESAMLALL